MTRRVYARRGVSCYSGDMLGYHINTFDDGAAASMARARPAIVKTLDWSDGALAKIVAARPAVVILRRWADDRANFYPTPEANAGDLWRWMAGDLARAAALLTGVRWYIEQPWNERGQGSRDDLARHARASVQWMEWCEAASYKAAIGCFSAGNPEPGDFSAYTPALRHAGANGHIAAFHDYWRPELATDANPYHRSWLVARWARLYEVVSADCRPAVAVTEFGVDRGVYHPGEAGGWRSFGMSAGEYGQQLAEAAQIEHDEAARLGVEFLGATVFACGTYPDTPAMPWKSFDVAGMAEVETVVRRLSDTAPDLPPDPYPVPAPPAPQKDIPLILSDVFKPSDDYARVELYGWPVTWDQLNDSSTDPDGDQGKKDNCGVQSIASALKYLTGVEMFGDTIRDILAKFDGAPLDGYLTVEHLTWFLARYCDIECDRYAGGADTLLRPVVEAAIAQGYPVIVLFAWDYARFRQTGHFMPIVGVSDEQVFAHQVWGGGRVAASWADFETWQKTGIAFVLKRRRDSQLPG